MEDMKNSIRSVLKRNGAVKVGLFGSMARGEAKPGSDVDIFVKFDPNKKVSLFDLIEIQAQLERNLRRRVDLVTKLNKYVEPYAKKDMIKII